MVLYIALCKRQQVAEKKQVDGDTSFLSLKDEDCAMITKEFYPTVNAADVLKDHVQLFAEYYVKSIMISFSKRSIGNTISTQKNENLYL